jgi:hypothetical protein
MHFKTELLLYYVEIFPTIFAIGKHKIWLIYSHKTIFLILGVNFRFMHTLFFLK